MKYLKTYEQYKTPQIGDYVAVKKPEILKYIPTYIDVDLDKIYITQIIDKKNNTFKVKYNEDFFNSNKEWWLKKDEILGFSKNIKDLEHFTISTKYNL